MISRISTLGIKPRQCFQKRAAVAGGNDFSAVVFISQSQGLHFALGRMGDRVFAAGVWFHGFAGHFLAVPVAYGEPLTGLPLYVVRAGFDLCLCCLAVRRGCRDKSPGWTGVDAFRHFLHVPKIM